MKQSLKYIAALPLLAFALFGSDRAHAQIISRGDLFGPGAPPPFVGVFAGLGKHAQQGTFRATCGCTFENGDGNGLLAGAFFELPIDYEWAIGLAVGYDSKHTSTTVFLPDTAIVQDQSGNTDIPVLKINRTSSITTKYLMIAPYGQYQFFRMGPFVQLGPSIGILIGSDYQQTRDLLQTDAIVNGQPAHDIRFLNGTLSEAIDKSQPIPGVSGLRLGLLISAGYNIQVSERSVFSPLLTYDLPLTTISTVNASGWKIGSLYASAEIKLRLD